MKKCGHKKQILGKVIAEEIYPDEEPFKSGEYLKMDDIELLGGDYILVHYCLDCNKIIEAWVELEDTHA